ncbi:MAG: hypothetical protein ACRETQ_12830 [Gammaproteobacteria bacterium]
MSLQLRKFCLLGLILALSGCGGGNSSLVNYPSIQLVTPIATSIAAGTSLQLNATVTNVNDPNEPWPNQTVLWYVNGIAGGNAFIGTITPQGLYTAPDIPTSNGTVTISAAPQAFPAVTASLQVGVTFANASLNGDFVFTLSGTQNGGPWAAVGSFTASNGTISGGLEDVNGPGGVSEALPFNGSYFVDASGLGTATLTSSRGTQELSFTLNTQAQATVMTTGATTIASGSFYPQQSTALTLSSLNSAFVFGLSGSATSGPLSVIGTFVTNGSATLSYAEEDFNDGNTTVNQPFSGSYSIGSGGRGTASFTVAGATRTFSFYIVSPQQLQFIETDSSANLNGSAFQQESVNSSVTLAGTYVFFVSGNQGSNGYAAAGGFTPDTTTAGSVSAGTSDINIGGTDTTNTTLTGNFTVGASGRGTLALSGASGTHHYVYYLISPTAGLILTSDAGVNASGQLSFQTGGYATAALSGSYNFSVASAPGAPTPTISTGLLTLNSLGALAGFEDNNTSGTATGQLSATGTYAMTVFTSTTSTRGVMTLTTNGGASTGYAMYPITSGSVILVSGSGTPTVGLLNSQY